MATRVATPNGDRDGLVGYADAAGKSQMDAVILDPSTFKSTSRIRSITYVRTGIRWKSTFASTSYIYGIEMMAVLSTLMEKGSAWPTNQ